MGEIPSVLALEPDPDRAKALTHLVHEYVDANVVVSASADVAVSVLSRRMPQLILLSAFTPPADERSLMTFLRGVTRDNVPVLIISSIPEPSAARSPWSLRRTPDTRPAIMRDALGARMLGALDKSKDHGHEGRRWTSSATSPRRCWTFLALTDGPLGTGRRCRAFGHQGLLASC